MIRTDDRDTEQRRELIRRARERQQREGRRGLRRVPPRPRQPAQIEREYIADMRRLARRFSDNIREELEPQLENLVDEAGMRDDGVRSDGWASRLAAIVGNVQGLNEDAADGAEEMVSGYAERLQEFSDDEQKRMLRSVFGVEIPFAREDDVLESWVRENVSYIRTIADDQLNEVQGIVNRSIREGNRHTEIMKNVRKRFGISERRARVIARDQTSKLRGEIDRKRQRDLGIGKFIWRTADDERVRQEHADREGQEYDWDSPPDGEIPGQPVQCRCRAAPAVQDLLNELEAEE